MVGRIGAGTRGMGGECGLRFLLPGPFIREAYLVDGLIFLSRHLAIVGSKGHVATFDWQTGSLHAELQLRENCRDIK